MYQILNRKDCCSRKTEISFDKMFKYFAEVILRKEYRRCHLLLKFVEDDPKGNHNVGYCQKN